MCLVTPLIALPVANHILFLFLNMFKQQLKEIVAVEQQLLLSEIAGSLDDKLFLAQVQLVYTATIVSTEVLASGETRLRTFLTTAPAC
ncbi:MAG: hypothetical protein Q8R42_05795, partial [Desulfocapsaceae bacterium]|nr:hypothetical protein [Desulfocapsaceae bacterium]